MLMHEKGFSWLIRALEQSHVLQWSGETDIHQSVRGHEPGQTVRRFSLRRFPHVRTLHFPRYSMWIVVDVYNIDVTEGSIFPGVLITQLIFGSNSRILNRNQKRKFRVKRPKNGRPRPAPGQSWAGIGDENNLVYFDEDKMYDYVDPKVDAEYFETLGKVKEFDKVDYAAYYDYSDLGILDFTRRSK